jgi:ferredoxin
MKISAHPERCDGHGLCFQTDPDFFPLDDDGVIALGQGIQVPQEMEGVVRHAVRLCPVLALTIEEDT